MYFNLDMQPAVAAPPPKWMSTAEAAAHLGVVVRTVYRFINEGDLVGYKLGRVMRVRSTDLDTFLQTCRIQPGDLDHLLGDDTNE